MQRRVFLIALVLVLNLLEVVRAEEILNCVQKSEKNDLKKSSKDYFSEITLPETAMPLDGFKPINFVKAKDEKKDTEDFIKEVNNSVEDSFEIEGTQLALASTRATLSIFSPLLTKSKKGGVWFRPYAAFEDVPLKNGYRVKNISYGSLVGADTDAKPLKNDWEVVHSGYLGYTGSEQSYNTVKQTQMSGFGGVYSTFYKKDFFSAIVLTAGGSVINSNDSQDIVGINAGVISRTGYNIKLPRNIVFQPNYIMSYTFDNTFDYKNNKGEQVRDAPLSIIHIVPSARFSAKLKNGWEPFLVFNMNFNVLGKGEVTVNRVAQPTLSVNPYLEYGGGVQRISNDGFSTFVQALARSGGRNGITFLAGFRWALNK